MLDWVVGTDVPVSDITFTETLFLEPGVETDGNQIVAVFEGEGMTKAFGYGHHQDNYTDYVRDLNNADVEAFFSSVGAAGYGMPGNSYAADVSVPQDHDQ